MVSTRQLATLYGLTPAQDMALLLAQGRECAVCHKPFTRTDVPRRDHDHLTGLIRGMLCNGCNQSFGLHHDNAAWFRAMADYLDDPPAPHAIGHHYVPGSPGAAGEL